MDGSYLVRKHEQLCQAGVNVAPLGPPSLPLSGWITINEANYKYESQKIPRVLPGTPTSLSLCMCACIYCDDYTISLGVLYAYLAEGVGRSTAAEGAFRALKGIHTLGFWPS